MALTPPQYKQMKQFLESDQRNKKTALLQDDLEPGPLKDELKGTFDPTQETYEEYLRRINLADGGMLVKPGFGGVRQGYREPRFPKGKGIQLSNEQIQLLKDEIDSIEDENPIIPNRSVIQNRANNQLKYYMQSGRKRQILNDRALSLIKKQSGLNKDAPDLEFVILLDSSAIGGIASGPSINNLNDLNIDILEINRFLFT